MSDDQDTFDSVPQLDLPEPPPLDPSAVWAGPATVAGAFTQAWRMLLARPELEWTFLGCALLTIAFAAWDVVEAKPTPTTPSEAFFSAFHWHTAVSMLVIFPLISSALYLAVEITHQGGVFLLNEFAMKVLKRAPLFLLAGILMTMACIPGFILCVVPGVVIWSHVAFTTLRATLEGEGPIRAITGSWTMTQDLRWLLFLVYLINMAIMWVLSLPMTVATMMNLQPGHPTPHSTFQVGAMLVVTVASAILSNFVGIVFGWIYLERRAGRI